MVYVAYSKKESEIITAARYVVNKIICNFGSTEFSLL